jgi:4-methyl-5(b-hydroxyethyl)-thiazole monophosphate biosynthesis
MVYIHLADGFEEIEALTAFDLLKRAGIGVETVSVMNSLSVQGAHGLQVFCDLLFEDADYDACDMIVLPGGMPGAKNLSEQEQLVEKLHVFANQGRPIAAICAAPGYVLGLHGILKGRKATCYPGYEEFFENATFIDENVVVDGNIITSKGPATAIDFALAIIGALKGSEVEAQIAKDILYS